MGHTRHLRARTVIAWTLASALLGLARAAADGPGAKLDYARAVRPILSNNCFKCHGPDAKERRGRLRLDVPEGIQKKSKSGMAVVEPGKPEASELLARINASDESRLMPPVKSGKKLTEDEKRTLRRWIEEGAGYQEHWAFAPPRRPPVPMSGGPPAVDGNWGRNEIDRFIRARLEAAKLEPLPEAPRTALIRRVTLDLTGLPPTLDEVDRFLADSSADAYERAVDRLLASPRYGERMAVDWLDAARFADTNGYHIDNGRDMTLWREWVIRSFNQNLPFDQFTVEQLAGDLLPEATVEQRIASGFNRNHMINFEGGAIPEEYQAAYIIDRVSTTGTVWMGLTVACSQCHDHKFDPLTQKDFYRLYAFFNNLPENGLDGYKGNSVPLLKVPSAEQNREQERLAAEIRRIDEKLAGAWSEVDAAQAAWEVEAAKVEKADWTAIEIEELRSEGGADLERLADGSILASGKNPYTDAYTITARTGLPEVTALRIEALADDRFPAKGPGRSSNGNIVLTEVQWTRGRAGKEPAKLEPLKIKAASADFSQKDFPVANAVDGKAETGWAIDPQVGKEHTVVVEADGPVKLEEGRFTLVLEFRSQFGQHQLGRFRLSATSARDPHGKGGLPEEIQRILAQAPADRTDDDRKKLRGHYRSKVSPEGKAEAGRLAQLRKEQTELEARIPTTMVMQELSEPRDTFLLVRGQYDKKGDKVEPGVPGFLPPLSEDAPRNRLGLARWLVSPTHPLTARVIVNRYWQIFFGTGLVKTAEDFGSQGEPPSHPELLDWLAVEFTSPERGSLAPAERRPWDVKGLIRLLVTSAAYRQSSALTPEVYERDPENRLIGRGPRFRLQAEFIRDQALSVSGLLDDRIAGHSVSPYQPPGLWEELAYREDGKNWTAQAYSQSKGSDLYRRSMYTFWKRTSPPPQLTTFDAPDRETCTVRRPRTNTPLQALILLNDPTYVEAARKLAERMMREAGPGASERIAFAFRLATARPPEPAEAAILRAAFEKQAAAYRKDEAAALKLLAVGEAPRDEKLDARELAAWTLVASMILNLDETLTKG